MTKMAESGAVMTCSECGGQLGTDDPRVSPSLVEAAARAAMLASTTYAHDEDMPLKNEVAVAEAVLDAVGDALRLKGAQTERERIRAIVIDLMGLSENCSADAAQHGASATAEMHDTRIDAYRIVLAALGGVHPEASDG